MKILDIMSRSDDKFFLYLVRENLSDVFISGHTKPKNSLLLFWALFFIAGTEPFKVILRKNIGISSLALTRLLVSSFLYLYYAGFIALLSFLPGGSDDASTGILDFWFSKTSIITCSFFYFVFAIGSLILGIVSYHKGNAAQKIDSSNYLKHLYRGDSRLFFTSLSDTTKTEFTWYVREPLFCFIVSVLITMISPLIGMPLLLTSVSFFVNEWFQVKDVWRSALKAPQNTEEEEFSVVRSI